MKFVLKSAAIFAAMSAASLVSAQTTLTLSSWVPPQHAITKAQQAWCGIAEKNTNGRIKCNQLPKAVAAPPGTYDAVKNGLADVSFVVHGYTPGRFATTKMAEFPFLGNKAESVSVAYNKVALANPAVMAEHPGLKVLAFFTHGPGLILNTKKAITKLDDTSGLKFRVGGGMVSDLGKSLNMNITLKPAPETFELLSGGVMDGTLLPMESVESFKFASLIKHATTFPGGLYNTSFVFVMNQAKYDALSADDKKAIDGISGEFAARMMGKAWDEADASAAVVLKNAGAVTAQAPAAFVADVRSKIAGLEAAWATDAEAKGLKNAKQVLADLRAEIVKNEK